MVGTRETPSDRVIVYVAMGELRRGEQSVKVSEGALQLLMFLALHGRASREVIVDRLWPELDGDAGNNALKVCVHRARAQLEDASSIVVDKGSYSLGKDIVSSFPRIQALVARAAHPISDDMVAEFSATFDQLARGLVAGWAPWEWFHPYTRSLLDAMHALGDRLGQHELESGNPQLALQIARRMIRADSLDEGARELAIRSYERIGNRTAASAEFQVYRDLLQRELGTEPTANLRQLVGAR